MTHSTSEIEDAEHWEVVDKALAIMFDRNLSLEEVQRRICYLALTAFHQSGLTADEAMDSMVAQFKRMYKIAETLEQSVVH